MKLTVIQGSTCYLFVRRYFTSTPANADRWARFYYIDTCIIS